MSTMKCIRLNDWSVFITNCQLKRRGPEPRRTLVLRVYPWYWSGEPRALSWFSRCSRLEARARRTCRPRRHGQYQVSNSTRISFQVWRRGRGGREEGHRHQPDEGFPLSVGRLFRRQRGAPLRPIDPSRTPHRPLHLPKLYRRGCMPFYLAVGLPPHDSLSSFLILLRVCRFGATLLTDQYCRVVSNKLDDGER